MSPELLHKYFAAGCLVRAKQLSNGDHVLREFVPGNGGGIFGAAVGCAIGKFVGEVVCRVPVAIVCKAAEKITGAPSGSINTAAQVAISPWVEPFSNGLAVAGGITGGTITGPV